MIIDKLLTALLFGLLKVSAPLSIKEKAHGPFFHYKMSSYLQISKKPRFPHEHIWKEVGRSSIHLDIRVYNMDSFNSAFCTVDK